MQLFRPIQSFRTRLMVVVALSSLIASALVAGTNTIRGLIRGKANARTNLAAQLDIIALNCTASLAFDTPEDAQQVLSSLRAVPNVWAAALYNKQHELFAAFQKPGTPQFDLQPGMPDQDNMLFLTKPVMNDDESLGTLVMAYDFGDTLSRIESNVKVSLLIAAIAAVGALLVALRLQRVLAQPVTELSRAASTVSRTGDFSVRATKFGDDELGRLTDTFNDMLGQVEKANERFRMAVESAPNAMIMVDAQGQILLVNAQTERLFGYTRHELIGMPVDELVPQQYRANHPSFRNSFFMQPQARPMGAGRDLYGRRKDGIEVPVEIGLNPIVTEQGVRVLASVVDITERKRAEQERQKLLDAERAARAEAERASRMKDEFVATLSHELRTPLTAILGWAQMLRRGSVSETDAKQGLEVIERNARAQTQIIEDLLDMSRIISGKIRLEVQSVRLADVIEAALATIRPAAEACEIRLQTIIDPNVSPVRGDPNRLQQVIWNLLSNAIKFTPKGGRVQVALERVNSHVELSVSDTGEGIDPQFLPFVFERFRQADASTTRRHGGLGLGLAIVKQLIELHGGTVRAKSPGAGRGSTFTVHLPLPIVHAPESDELRQHPRANRPAAAMTESCPELDGVRVLVVDDEPDARNLIRRVLEDCNADVTTASTASDALAHIQQHQVDVLISDIGMPQEDGYQLMQSVRALPADRGGATPAVALTAFARSEDRTRALLTGYQMHVAKPVEPAELIAIIASLAGRTTRPGREHSS